MNAATLPISKSASQNKSGKNPEELWPKEKAQGPLQAKFAESIDVLVVGSGPTGLMAALLLQRCGVSVRILDKGEAQAHESRAFGIQARTLELLQNLGLESEFLKRGAIAVGVQGIIKGRLAAEINIDDLRVTDTPYSFIFMLPQSEIESILVEQLEKGGIQVEHRMDVIGFSQATDCVMTSVVDRYGHHRSIRSSYIIGADGAHSIVRKTLGLTFEGGSYPQDFILADCAIEWPLDYEHVKVFMNQRSLGLYLPIKGKSLGRVIAIDPDSKGSESKAGKESTTSQSLEFAEVQRAFQKASGIQVSLSSPIWTARYRIHHRCVNRYSEGRAFVAGDAAHVHSPIGAQGMNTGLQDVANLAWKLALAIKNESLQRLLETYHSERWPIGQKLLRFTDRAFGVLSSSKTWIVSLRNTIMPFLMGLLSKSKMFRTRAFHFVSQLGIRYHSNAFLLDLDSNDVRASKCAGAGYRAPNGMISRNYDIFSLIRGYCFHVLVLSRKSLSSNQIDSISKELASFPKELGLPLETHFITYSLMGSDPRIVCAESSQVFENYGLTHKNPMGLFLIRPDGYIAFRSDQLDLARLKRFLDRFRSGAHSAPSLDAPQNQ